MNTFLYFILLGLLLIALEFIFPSFLMAIIGMGCFLWSSVLIYPIGGIWASTGVFLGSLALVALVIILETKAITHTQIGQKLLLRSGKTQFPKYSKATPEYIGKQAISLTALSPTGVIKVSDEHYEAKSIDGFIEPHTPLIISGIDDFGLIVKKSNTTSSNI